MKKSSRIAEWVRLSRMIHRKIALPALFFFFIIALTGLMLGWKKNTAGVLLPKTQSGISTNPKSWLPIDDLHQKAILTLRDSISADLSAEIGRIDIRPQKGVAKFVFKDHYWEVQLDCQNGEVLQIAKRNSDLIERIHDGSILDHWFGTKGSPIKLVYTTLAGLALLGFLISGIWLYFGAKWIKKAKQ